jgi:hypothetical protein
MIPLGYMAKFVQENPQLLKAGQVTAIYSVSSCISEDFTEWINCWQHNGYWFFDTPSIIATIAKKQKVDLAPAKLFYYEGYELEFDDDEGWRPYKPEPAFPLAVVPPIRKTLAGFDVVTYFCNSSAECSPLSCNHLAEEIKTNPFCLLDTLEEAKTLLENGRFKNSEPGPYRIIAVYITD